MSKQGIPGIAMKTDLQGNRWPPSKCCTINCGGTCLSKDGVELPFCESCNKDEDLWRAWHEIT